MARRAHLNPDYISYSLGAHRDHSSDQGDQITTITYMIKVISTESTHWYQTYRSIPGQGITPNLVLIDCCRHKYVTFRGFFGFFEGNKSSHTIASVGVMVMTSHVEVVELKGEKEVEVIRALWS